MYTLAGRGNDSTKNFSLVKYVEENTSVLAFFGKIEAERGGAAARITLAAQNAGPAPGSWGYLYPGIRAAGPADTGQFGTHYAA
jgi:hypothetical protein